MTKLEHLFKFPFILIDGDKLDKNESLGIGFDESDPELIYAEAEIPYWDFLCVKDKWLPLKASYDKAYHDGKFDACIVEFNTCGSYLCAWPKEKFKDKLSKFAETFKKAEADKKYEIKTIDISSFLKDATNTISEGDK